MSEPIRTIVVGIAEVEEQDPQFAPAVELAERVGATLHLVHAFPVFNANLLHLDAFEVSPAEEVERRLDAARGRFEATASRVYSGDHLVFHLIPGSASEAILDVADREGADLVIVGATRRGIVASTTLGTTAQRVLRASRVPVLVTRRPTSDHPRRVLLTTDLTKLSGGVHERGIDLLTTLWGAQGVHVRSLLSLAMTSCSLRPFSRWRCGSGRRSGSRSS